MSTLRIIVMGVGGVGKSAVTNRFVLGRWIEKYDPTVEESYQTSIEIDGKALQLEILDTAGQEEYSPLRETFMHTGDGFLLVYSITDDQTLADLKSIREQILRVDRGKKIPIVVIGNKLDLEARDRAVSKEEGKALASQFGADFLEVSAKNNFKIKESFELLVRKVLAKKPNAGKSSGPGNVFGAGKIDNSNDDRQLRKSVSKRDSERKSTAPVSPKSSGKTRSSESTPPVSPNKPKKKSGCFIL